MNAAAAIPTTVGVRTCNIFVNHTALTACILKALPWDQLGKQFTYVDAVIAIPT